MTDISVIQEGNQMTPKFKIVRASSDLTMVVIAQGELGDQDLKVWRQCSFPFGIWEAGEAYPITKEEALAWCSEVHDRIWGIDETMEFREFETLDDARNAIIHERLARAYSKGETIDG
jgi:hypothetical protein